MDILPESYLQLCKHQLVTKVLLKDLYLVAGQKEINERSNLANKQKIVDCEVERERNGTLGALGDLAEVPGALVIPLLHPYLVKQYGSEG